MFVFQGIKFLGNYLLAGALCPVPTSFPVRKIPAAGPENGKFRNGRRKTGGNRQFNIIRQAGKPAFSGPEKN